MKSILIDTNLLVLLIAGNLDKTKVGQHRRLRQFDKFDLERLNRLASSHGKHISVPNVLSEVSNHLNSGDQEIVSGASLALARYIEHLDEVYVPSSEVVKNIYFNKFGLADAAIIDAAREKGATVLTSDWPLARFLIQLNVPAINIFNLKTGSDFR